MRALPSLILLMILLLPLTAQYLNSQTVEGCYTDPVPLIKLLTDTIEKLVIGNFSNASELIDMGLKAGICDKDLTVTHKRVYETLSKLLNLLEAVDEIESRLESGNVTGLANRAEFIYNDLDSLRQYLNDYVGNYLSALRKYALDKVAFFKAESALSKGLAALELSIDNYMERLSTLYTELKEGQERLWIRISVGTDSPLYFGRKARVVIGLEPGPVSGLNLSGVLASVSVYLIIGNIIEISNHSTALIGGNTTIELRILGTEAVAEKGLELIRVPSSNRYYAPSKIIVRASALNGTVTGFRLTSAPVIALKPNIVFSVPPYARINSVVRVNVTSTAALPLNVSIYLDSAEPGNNIRNVTIEPGHSVIEVPIENVSEGYHTLIFVSGPHGMYVSGRWSSAIVIGSPVIPVSLNIPSVAVVPPLTLRVSGRVEAPLRTYNLTIYVDDHRVFEGIFTEPSFSVMISVPLSLKTLTMGSTVVRVVISAEGTGFKTSTYTVGVTVINAVTVLALAGLAGTAYLHPKIFEAITMIGSLAKEGVRVRREEKGFLAARRFRKFRLRPYYQRFVVAISRIVRPPEPHETLREFLVRAIPLLPEKLTSAVTRLISLFELDLYSKKAPDRHEAEALTQLIEDSLREGG